MDDDFNKIVAEFVGSLEQVFHHDWEYTQSMMGCTAMETAEVDTDEVDQIITPRDGSIKPTFLWPRLTEYWETEDWGGRGQLLSDYRRLLHAMQERGLEPIPPFSTHDPDH